jgi:hypothetical protein
MLVVLPLKKRAEEDARIFQRSDAVPQRHDEPPLAHRSVEHATRVQHQAHIQDRLAQRVVARALGSPPSQLEPLHCTGVHSRRDIRLGAANLTFEAGGYAGKRLGPHQARTERSSRHQSRCCLGRVCACSPEVPNRRAREAAQWRCIANMNMLARVHGERPRSAGWRRFTAEDHGRRGRTITTDQPP